MTFGGAYRVHLSLLETTAALVATSRTVMK